jgi:anti-sigma factor RsiW
VLKHISDQIALYLDGELQESERIAVERHIKLCSDCRAALEAERDLVAAIRKSRPGNRAPQRLRQDVERLLAQSGRPRTGRSYRVPIAACAVLVVALAAAWFTVGGTFRAARSPLVDMAVRTHLRYLEGQLPLELFSRSPEKISAWFAGKLRFNLRLPDYPQRSAEPKPYQVEGARLVGFADEYAAYVVYRLNGRPISLIVTSETAATPSGGEEIPWEGLRFHFQTVSGWKVLTWSDNGLTYALVSDLEERGQASCGVCHQDERVFRGLQSSARPM